MKKEDLIRAIGEVDDRLIEEAYNYQEEKKPFLVPWMKYGLGFACILMLSVVVMKPFSPKSPEMLNTANEVTESAKDSNGGMMIPNPWSDYASVDEAVNGTGIALTVDENVLSTYGKVVARGITGQIIEIDVVNNDGKMMIRKGVDSSEDLSGDYGTYEETLEKETEDGRKVSLKMNGSNAYLAEWSEGEYNYVISFTEGMLIDEMMSIIETVH